MREIFLEKLPRKGKSIDWTKSIGQTVKFIYDDVEGEIEIVEYIKDKHSKLKIKYQQNMFMIDAHYFRKCSLGKLLRGITGDFKTEIGQTFKDNKRDMTIIDRKYIKNKNGDNLKYYKYKCNKCGFECGEHYKKGEYQKEMWIGESHLLKGDGCSCCFNRAVVPEINSIVANEETHWMIPYFQGGYDEAKKYTKGSGVKIFPVCTECGRVKNKPISILDIYKNHSIGCMCGDGLSYPNKVGFSVLEQLQVDFEVEYSPEWIKPKRYDFYIPSKNLIIEMDGGWHYTDNNLSGKTKNESKAIDEYKEQMAQKYGIEVIRINCDCSNLEYIKDNILESKLNTIFDFSKVNWLKCEEFALSNLVKKVCEYWNNKEEWETAKDLGNIFKLSQITITKYLKKGVNLGWCNYDAKEEIIKNNRRGKKGIPVQIFKNNILLGEFKSASDLERQSKKLFGVKLFSNAISSVCLNKYNLYKGFTFKRVLYNTEEVNL